MRSFIPVLAGLLLFFIYSNSIACSCDRLYFCEYMKEELNNKVVIKATVHHFNIYPTFSAVYLKVDKIFRDDVGITEVIKLYGNDKESQCYVNVIKRFKDGDEVYLAIGLQYNGYDIGWYPADPDIFFENFWHFGPTSCQFVVLPIDDVRVEGSIFPGYFEYPKDHFEERLVDCSFQQEELHSARCEDLNFIIFPNPSEDGTFLIENNYRYSSIDLIRIYAINGQLIETIHFDLDTWETAQFTINYSGVFIMQFHCSGTIHYRKIIVGH